MRSVNDGQEQWGEAAPLPGFSDESLDDVIQAAQRRDWNRFPSLQFAHASLTPGPIGATVPVNRLLVSGGHDFPLELHRLRDLPHTVIKLKVARHASSAEDIRQVRQVCEALRSDQRLRLDANRGWTFDQAEQFLAAIADCPIEYIEEPTDDPTGFETLFAACGVPYALDETLRERCDLNRFPHASALIIKPTLLGLNDSLADWAGRGKRLVFSSAFESGIGLWHVARLACQYDPQTPAGLDTYRWLADDVLRPRFKMDRAEFSLRQAWHVDLGQLEELTS